jgi:predicted RNase H-like nuclease (RuvC/YqgF family)
MPALALPNRTYQPMPAPHNDGQQAGWLATVGLLAAGAGAIVGAIVNQVGTWRQELIKRRTATDQQKQDREANYTDNLRGDLERLTLRFDDMVQQKDEDALKTVERERKIAHLENQLERLQAKVEILEEKKASYESEIIGLKQIIADRDATIAQLRKELADALVIGTHETAPPARNKD